MEGSIITDEMRAAIGVESEPSIYEIEKEPIRRWAEAIGDPNPLYHNEEYARSQGYRSIIAPPGFIANYAFPVKAGEWLRIIPETLTRGLNGANEYHFYRPIQAGDTITATKKLVRLTEHEGRLGKMLYTDYETSFKNQYGETVARTVQVIIRY